MWATPGTSAIARRAASLTASVSSSVASGVSSMLTRLWFISSSGMNVLGKCRASDREKTNSAMVTASVVQRQRRVKPTKARYARIRAPSRRTTSRDSAFST